MASDENLNEASLKPGELHDLLYHEIYSQDGDRHLIDADPIRSTQAHEPSQDCWCEPWLEHMTEDEEGEKTWRHRRIQ